MGLSSASCLSLYSASLLSSQSLLALCCCCCYCCCLVDSFVCVVNIILRLCLPHCFAWQSVCLTVGRSVCLSICRFSLQVLCLTHTHSYRRTVNFTVALSLFVCRPFSPPLNILLSENACAVKCALTCSAQFALSVLLSPLAHVMLTHPCPVPFCPSGRTVTVICRPNPWGWAAPAFWVLRVRMGSNRDEIETLREGKRERERESVKATESSSFSFPVVVFMLLFELILFRCVLSAQLLDEDMAWACYDYKCACVRVLVREYVCDCCLPCS